MTWKTTNISNAGTSTKFGSDDMDKVSKLFSNQDVDDVVINSDWKFNQTSGTLIKEIAEPSTPASGYASLYVDSTTKKLCIKHSTGDVVILE